jgi:hypothetical protein
VLPSKLCLVGLAGKTVGSVAKYSLERIPADVVVVVVNGLQGRSGRRFP